MAQWTKPITASAQAGTAADKFEGLYFFGDDTNTSSIPELTGSTIFDDLAPVDDSGTITYQDDPSAVGRVVASGTDRQMYGNMLATVNMGDSANYPMGFFFVMHGGGSGLGDVFLACMNSTGFSDFAGLRTDGGSTLLYQQDPSDESATSGFTTSPWTDDVSGFCYVEYLGEDGLNRNLRVSFYAATRAVPAEKKGSTSDILDDASPLFAASVFSVNCRYRSSSQINISGDVPLTAVGVSIGEAWTEQEILDLLDDPYKPITTPLPANLTINQVDTNRITATITGFVSGQPEAVDDINLWPILTVNGTDRVDVEKIATISDEGGGAYQIEFNLTGRIFAGDTVELQSGLWMSNGTESGGNYDGTLSHSVVATQGNAYTRYSSEPACNWGARDCWVHHEDETAVHVAVDAIDGPAGIEYVEFVFDAPVTVDTSPSEVSDRGSNVYRVTNKRLLALYGDRELGWWYVTLDISGEADGKVASVTEVRVRTNDGVTHNMIADGWITQREIRKLTVTDSNRIYVDGTNGDDTTGDGSSGSPYATLTKANTESTPTTYEVRIAPGSYALVNIGGRTAGTDEFLLWRADTGLTGDGGDTVTLTATLNVDGTSSDYVRTVGSVNAFRDITVAITGTGVATDIRSGWEASGSDYFALERVTINCSGAQHFELRTKGTPHTSWVRVELNDTYRVVVGPVNADSAPDLLITDYTVRRSGTLFSGGEWESCCLRGITEIDANTTLPSGGTHTAGFKSESTEQLEENPTYTAATRTLSAASGEIAKPYFVTYGAARDDKIAVGSIKGLQGDAGTVTDGFIKSFPDVQTVVFYEDVGTVDFTSTNTKAGTRGRTLTNVIISDVIQYGGGDNAADNSQNMGQWHNYDRVYAYNWVFTNNMASQQALKVENSGRGLYLLGITSIPADGATEAWARGFDFSGDSAVARPIGVWIRNCIWANANHGGNPFLMRKRLIGPNIYLNDSGANPSDSLNGLDGSVVVAGDSPLGLQDLSATPPLVYPSSSSSLASLVTPVKDDRRFDFYGNALTDNTPTVVGAAIAGTPTPSPPESTQFRQSLSLGAAVPIQNIQSRLDQGG